MGRQEDGKCQKLQMQERWNKLGAALVSGLLGSGLTMVAAEQSDGTTNVY